MQLQIIRNSGAGEPAIRRPIHCDEVHRIGIFQGQFGTKPANSLTQPVFGIDMRDVTEFRTVSRFPLLQGLGGGGFPTFLNSGQRVFTQPKYR